MFFSKIWFFLLAVAATTALTIALVMPKPTERKEHEDEQRRLVDACSVTNILLTENARFRIDLASQSARFSKDIPRTLAAAGNAKEVLGDHNMAARKSATKLLKKLEEISPPDFIMLLDKHGRVVVRVGINLTQYGDSMAGYHLVDDALAGYLRDDLWLLERTLYQVAAAPVINREVAGGYGDYVGAIVLGHAINKEFATSLAKKASFNVAFYVGDRAVANSTAIQLHKDIIDKFKEIGDVDRDRELDCAENPLFEVVAGDDSYAAVIARLPGEAASFGAFYSVFIERSKNVGFSGSFDAITKDDLSFGNFPWIPVGIVFLVVVLIGIFLMVLEADRPLRRLANDSVALAKGERDRLEEDRHRGKFGSIARSVNIELDKKQREAKAAKKDLDQLLGPAPDDGIALGAASPLPVRGPGGPASAVEPPPPPSDFTFGGKKKKPAKEPASVADPGPAFELDLPPPPPAVAKTAPIEESGPVASPTDALIPPPPVSLPESPPPAPEPPPLPTRRAPSPPPMPEAIDDDILAADDDDVPAPAGNSPGFDDPTVVANPDRALLDASSSRDDDPTAIADKEEIAAANDDAYLRHIFEEFVALKKKCGESITNLTFQKFSTKLKKNRQALISKHGCAEVKFQVYIKDGKAALKATPVKA